MLNLVQDQSQNFANNEVMSTNPVPSTPAGSLDQKPNIFKNCDINAIFNLG